MAAFDPWAYPATATSSTFTYWETTTASTSDRYGLTAAWLPDPPGRKLSRWAKLFGADGWLVAYDAWLEGRELAGRQRARPERPPSAELTPRLDAIWAAALRAWS